MNERANSLNIKVLMYHRLVSEKPKKKVKWHYVLASEFKKQLMLIDKMGFTPITFEDYLLYQEGKLTLPPKPIIITFDDGYRDTYELAVPLLSEMDMRAVVFALGNRSKAIADWDMADPADLSPLMNNEQLREISDLGFEIGSHSYHHVKLSTINASDMELNIVKSKEVLEDIIKKPINVFCYPYGDVDLRAMKLISESGYQFACGVFSGGPKFGDTTFDIRRLAVNQDTSIVNFALKILTPYEYVEYAYHKFKHRKTPGSYILFSNKNVSTRPEESSVTHSS